MKKILSMTLASAMVASMAATAFAAAPTYKISIDPDETVDPVYKSVFVWNSDDEVITLNNNAADGTNNDIAFGKTAFYALKGTDASTATGVTKADEPVLVYEYDAVKGLKLKDTWSMNGNLVEKVELVKKKISTVNSTATDNSYTAVIPAIAAETSATLNPDNFDGARQYAYFVAVTLKDSTSTSEKFINGEIALSKSSGKGDGVADKLDYKKNKFEVALDAKFERVGVSGDATITDTKKTFDFAQNEDEEFSLTIINDDTATFVVDTRGQGKLVLTATNKFDADIAAKFDADLNFIKTNGATFNRTGVLTIYAEEGTYLYEIKADGTLAKSKAKYDDVEEAFVLKTRTLGNYVISSEELDLAGNTTEEEIEVVEPGEEVVVEPTTPVNPNPSTGAAA